ncbi:MAG: sialidase family protein [Thermoanaerobaculia bacterium]
MIALIVCAVVGLASCAQRPAEPAPAALPVSQIPDLGLGPRDDIDAADLAVSPQGEIHVVWRAVVRKADGATPEYPVLYLRGERGGQTWGRPVEVDRLGEPPRVALASGKVHVLFGPKLRHFLGDGRTFRELAPRVPAGRARALSFDVLPLGEDLLVAYLLEASSGGLELHVSRDGGPDRTVARFPASFLSQPEPRLAAEGGRLYLLCAVNLEEGSEPGADEPFAKVLFLSSADGGATWTEPVEAARGHVAQAVALIPRQGALHAFYSAFGLWSTRSADGRSWSAPVAVAPYSTTQARGSTESGPVVGSPGPDGGFVAWIDARFRKSDRRWWNPLGGVPWSDDNPFWANNDVFALPLDGIARAPLRRLTPPLSSARSLRAAVIDGRTILLWAGRLEVGKDPGASGRPPALFYTTYPGSPAGAGSP